MLKTKTLAIAAALVLGASTMAMAQSTTNNASKSGGPGTHAGAATIAPSAVTAWAL